MSQLSTSSVFQAQKGRLTHSFLSIQASAINNISLSCIFEPLNLEDFSHSIIFSSYLRVIPYNLFDWLYDDRLNGYLLVFGWFIKDSSKNMARELTINYCVLYDFVYDSEIMLYLGLLTCLDFYFIILYMVTDYRWYNGNKLLLWILIDAFW